MSAKGSRKGSLFPRTRSLLPLPRKLDERRQRALTRYYLAAGSGGVAVGVHTTQFAIRDPKIGLYQPVLELAMEEATKGDVVKVAGVCGSGTRLSKRRSWRVFWVTTQRCSAWVA
jgi:hypothetical protein